MKVIPDASDVLRKNMQMLQSIKALVPAEIIKQSNECVDTVKRFLKLTITKAWGSSGKLEDSINAQVLNQGSYTAVGIGNKQTMPPYWRIQEYGGTVPPRTPKSLRRAATMHFFGYGQEWFLKYVNGFVITAKNYFANGFSFASNRAKVAFIALMNRIMPK
jgi:hypothetical protein